MNNQEARDVLVEMMLQIENEDSKNDYETSQKIWALEIGIDSIDKDIEQKPTVLTIDDDGETIKDEWICPNCEKKFIYDGETFPNRCGECGKLLDWSDEVKQ
jgi:phage/plasmid primase-like uncharacterized protein